MNKYIKCSKLWIQTFKTRCSSSVPAVQDHNKKEDTDDEPKVKKSPIKRQTTTEEEEEEKDEDDDISPAQRPKDKETNNKESTNLCPEYKWGKCKSFANCPYDHPPRCWSWIQHGKCPYKKKCRYSHPPLCRNSLREQQCLNSECRFFHTTGTKRYNSRMESNTNPSFHEPQVGNTAMQYNHNSQIQIQPTPIAANYQSQHANQQVNGSHANQQTLNQQVNSIHPNPQTFLVNMFRELAVELRKEISTMIKSSLNTAALNTNGHQQYLTQTPVPVQVAIQPTHENYYPTAPTYSQTLQNW